MLKIKISVVRLCALVTLECLDRRPALRTLAFLLVVLLRERRNLAPIVFRSAPKSKHVSAGNARWTCVLPLLPLSLLPSAHCDIRLTAGRQSHYGGSN